MIRRNVKIPLMQMTVKISLMLMGSIAYATARYNVFGTVAWADWPAFIVNKGMCLGLCGFLLFAALCGRRQRAEQAARWAQAAYVAMIGHVLLSLGLLTPQYFGEKLFTDGQMNLTGQLALMAGALAACAFVGSGRTSAIGTRRLSLLVAQILLLAHLAAIGLPSWLAPWTWPAHLPPITLLSAVLVMASLILHTKAQAR